ncbi:MAG: shikimate dehydrogenase [Candidatus Omnitrophica bacterium]|nr:shikimate dehydrogenase [Candidatus Omnitrophota bacterium]
MAKLKYGLIGYPVKHSLSPAMHNAAFEELGMDAEYSLFEVEPKELDIFLKEMPAKKISGLNVTIPHQIGARDYIEKSGVLDENAGKLGAVNTIKPGDDGKLRGYNTDGPGFYRSLVEDLKFEPEGRTVFVLGAGGAARAVVMYLGNGPKRIIVSDVDNKRAEDLKSQYLKYYDKSRIEITTGADISGAIAGADLLVNATPVGMREADPSPVEKSMLRAGMYVYDLVYNRPVTELVKAAQRARCYASTGLGMLLYQGAIAFEIWTGRQAPIAVMRKALKAALRT